MNPTPYLVLAASHAPKQDRRQFCLAAAARRADGAVVLSRNGAATFMQPAHHAEARVARKLDKGAVVFVARVVAGGEWALAKPCGLCRVRLRARRVEAVYYTV